MRVITGTARGRKLKEPQGMEMRPTTDLVKESIFNIIQFDIEGRRVLDLFAGTGQLGIEALSRGAAGAVFVDKEPQSVKLVEDNIKTCNFESVSKVMRCDAESFLRSGVGKFDIIFLDPPYDSDLLEKCLKLIAEIDILNPNGIMVCESRKSRILPSGSDLGMLSKEYKYGKIKLTVYVNEG